LHTGECEIRGDDIGDVAAHLRAAAEHRAARDADYEAAETVSDR